MLSSTSEGHFEFQLVSFYYLVLPCLQFCNIPICTDVPPAQPFFSRLSEPYEAMGSELGRIYEDVLIVLRQTIAHIGCNCTGVECDWQYIGGRKFNFDELCQSEKCKL